MIERFKATLLPRGGGEFEIAGIGHALEWWSNSHNSIVVRVLRGERVVGKGLLTKGPDQCWTGSVTVTGFTFKVFGQRVQRGQEFVLEMDWTNEPVTETSAGSDAVAFGR